MNIKDVLKLIETCDKHQVKYNQYMSQASSEMTSINEKRAEIHKLLEGYDEGDILNAGTVMWQVVYRNGQRTLTSVKIKVVQ